MRKIAINFTIVSLIFSGICLGNDIYQWTDDSGSVNFSDSPPSQRSKTEVQRRSYTEEVFSFANPEDRAQLGKNITIYEDVGLIVNMEYEKDDQLRFNVFCNNLQNKYSQIKANGPVFMEILALKSGEDSPHYYSYSQHRVEPWVQHFILSNEASHKMPIAKETEFLRMRMFERLGERSEKHLVLLEKWIPFRKKWLPYMKRN